MNLIETESGALMPENGTLSDLDNMSTKEQKRRAGFWLVKLAALIGGFSSPDDVQQQVIVLAPALAGNVNEAVFAIRTQNGVMVNDVSCTAIAGMLGTFWPSYGKLVECIKRWQDEQQSSLEAARARARPAGSSTYHDPRLAELSPNEKSWMAYYEKRAADGFKPIGQNVVSTRRPGEPEAMHKKRLMGHVLSLVRASAPKVWAILVSDEVGGTGADPEAEAELLIREGRCAGLGCIDHPDRRLEAIELDNRLFGEWDRGGRLLKPGIHPFDRSPAEYQQWKAQDGGYVTLERKMGRAPAEATS